MWKDEWMKSALYIFACLLLGGSSLAMADAPRESKVFERVFGMPRALPAELVAEVLALPVGEKLERDTTGDGRVDELWYLDTDKRHTIQPLLVVVRDGDGTLHERRRGNLHSDTYFWDHHANGWIDVVTVYQDDDGDGQLDQMGIFYDKRWPDEQDDLTVWWAVDVGGDNLLWFDVNGNYYQPLCQWRTHFSGDELFYQFRLTGEDEKWVNVWEDPFAFYDPTGDGASNLVVRISAIGHEVQNLRYSIDADHEARPGAIHNYDFSVTALPPEEGISTEGWAEKVLTIQGIETHPVLDWKNTKAFAKQAAWGSAMLTWDEINSNTDRDIATDPNERWEGVLNHASKFDDFPQVGGPPCSPFNNRVEVSHAPASPLRLYFDTADQRFHLLGAEYGYLDVDFNLDGEVDAAYAWKDESGDGVLDLRTVDVNNNGTVDIVQRLHGNTREFDLEFEDISLVFPQVVREVLEGSQLFVDAAVAVLGGTPEDVREVIDFYRDALPDYHREREVGLRIQGTPAGARFYLELARDRLYMHLRAAMGEDAAWAGVEHAYLDGDYAGAAYALIGAEGFAELEGTVREVEFDGQRYTRRIRLSLQFHDDPGMHAAGRPVTVPLALPEHEDLAFFDPDNCVLVEAEHWLAWRIVPHQVDDWSFQEGPMLSFIADTRGATSKDYYLYYGMEPTRSEAFPRLTNAVLDTPGHVAWESDAGAFRFYTGQIDFFGKHEHRLLPREERLLYPLVDVNYHEEQEWGIDALHVGVTSGLGGLTLYLDGEELPVQSPAGEGDVTFEHRVLGAGPVRAAVEVVARNVNPEAPDEAVVLRFFSYAGQADSEVQVHLPESLRGARLAPGIMRLEEGAFFADAGRGLLGTWGRQGDDIGHIGLALLLPPDGAVEVLDLPHEKRFLAEPRPRAHRNYDFNYWILGGWRRGMQYPIAPGIENWRREVESLAHRRQTGGSVGFFEVEWAR